MKRFYMKKKNEFLYHLIPVLILAIFISYLQYNLLFDIFYPSFTLYSNETDEFREMVVPDHVINEFIEFSRENQLDVLECLTTFMVQYEFDLSTFKSKSLSMAEYNEQYNYLRTYYGAEYDSLYASNEAIWRDLSYFPVPKSSKTEEATISFENSWGSERNYNNSTSRHEGTDIMASNNQRGYFPIVSMTDGVVEQIGWLEKGGYRIGIRSPHGGYFYYAHLYNYASEFKQGDVITAGQLLGFMGDSGYSKVEGTVGNFDVHLHLGIYIQTYHHDEISVNPYWILKYLENKRLSYIY